MAAIINLGHLYTCDYAEPGEINLQVTAELMRYMYLGVVFPTGVAAGTGLPTSAQLMGPLWSDQRLVRIARAVERAFPTPRPATFQRP